jgi:uncharacterized GH25 family protein
MKRTFGAAVIGLVAVSVAQAHFPFIVPQGDGTTAKVVFSDDLDPDKNVNIEKLDGTKLTLRDAAGKESPLAWKKGEACYVVSVPGSGPRVVYGVTDYGVLQKGDAKPFRLVYYPKAVIGGAAKAVGGSVKLEIVTAGEAGKTRFQVLADGKPAADLEVTVMVPDSSKKPEKKPVKTDKDGFTPAFAETGRFGVTAKFVEAKPGEHAGKKYDEVRYYATLVADVK